MSGIELSSKEHTSMSKALCSIPSGTKRERQNEKIVGAWHRGARARTLFPTCSLLLWHSTAPLVTQWPICGTLQAPHLIASWSYKRLVRIVWFGAIRTKVYINLMSDFCVLKGDCSHFYSYPSILSSDQNINCFINDPFLFFYFLFGFKFLDLVLYRSVWPGIPSGAENYTELLIILSLLPKC